MLKITHVFADRQPFHDHIALHMAHESQAGCWVARPPAMEKQPAEGMINEPFLTLDHSAAQRLMDELWHCGIRPSEGTGSAGQLAATQQHLADMRQLAFHALKVPQHG